MIALSKAYVCVLGAPVITTIDPAIFTYGYFTHCMACGFCKDSCCSYGVDIDVENVARILALGEDFDAFVGVPRAGWFTSQTWQDREFPGGAQKRTRVLDGACVFLDREKRGCKIHAYSVEKGIDYHRLKPLVSTLFPVTFEGGALVASGEIEDGSLICSGEGPTLYDGVRSELAHYFGEDFVAELDVLRAGGA
jgi:hypothetical protein